MSEYICDTCDGVLDGGPPRLMKHNGPCECLRCPVCDMVCGSRMESYEWNKTQWIHHLLDNPVCCESNLPGPHNAAGVVAG